MLNPATRSRVGGAAARPSIIIAFAAFAAAGVLLWVAFSSFGTGLKPLGGPGRYDVPPRGEVSPVFLPDGRPVFIVHHKDDTVSVVDAFSSHTPWGITDMNVWCPSTRQFLEVAHEAHFDEYGAWHSAGPAPSGLTTFAFDAVELDRAGGPQSIRVGARRPPDPRGSPAETEPGRPPPCPPTDAPLLQTPNLRVRTGITGMSGDVVAHRVEESQVWGTPAEAVAAERDGWIVVRGTLLVAANDGFVQLCAEIQGKRPVGIGESSVPDERRCEGGAIVRGVAGVDMLINLLGPHPGSAYEEEGLWFAQVQDGVLGNLVLAHFIEPNRAGW